MPYIPQVRRDELSDSNCEYSMGDLNYMISTLLNRWLEDHAVSYTNINALIGMLECCKLELYRRVAAPYENEKLEVNGDVYTCE